LRKEYERDRGERLCDARIRERLRPGGSRSLFLELGRHRSGALLRGGDLPLGILQVAAELHVLNEEHAHSQ
jgi:hypothetical protein